MTKELFFQAILKFASGVVIVGLLLFLSAGTFYYWNAWLFIGALFVPMFLVGIILMFKNPELLRKRLNVKEKQTEQKLVVRISGVMFILSFAVAGLNFRYNWINLPYWISLLALVVFIFSYLLYAEVLRENTYLSRTIEVQENQKVIDTGLYGIVRHPMYAVTVIFFLSMPLVLGSLLSFIITLVYPFVIAKRIHSEEKLLEKELEGYSEYKLRVKYKMIPFIW